MGSGASQKLLGSLSPQRRYVVQASSQPGASSSSSKPPKTVVTVVDNQETAPPVVEIAPPPKPTGAPAPPPSDQRFSPKTNGMHLPPPLPDVCDIPEGPPSPCKVRSVAELKARLVELVGQVPTTIIEKSELVALVEEAEHRAKLKDKAIALEDKQGGEEAPPEERRSRITEILPPPWIKKESQTYPGHFYYVNVETNETTWQMPDFLRSPTGVPLRPSSRSVRSRLPELRASFDSADHGDESMGQMSYTAGAGGDLEEASQLSPDSRPRVSARLNERGVTDLLLVPPCGRAVTNNSSGPSSVSDFSNTLSQTFRLAVTPRAVRTTTGEEMKLTWAHVDLLGRGSNGSVFKALDQLTGQIVAVKEVMVAGSDEDQQYLQQLENEVSIMKELSHPHIVRYLAHDYVNDCLYMYMEHMPGGTLKQALGQFGQFDELLIAGYSRQLLAGLDYLHGRSPAVIHGDLKSSNILLDVDTRVKLADFGCSRRAHATITGTLRGSIPWMAPEVLLHCHYSCGSDIWSFGCVCIEMGTGKQPWGSFDNQMQAFLKIGMSQETPALPEGLSEDACSFIRACVQRAPEVRSSTQDLLRHPFVYGIKLPGGEESSAEELR
mmetsp:Transcript_13757/g.25196  ORF Transcript_13757/g.25196 Transcript_13757/m.25196 type:complete len:608 (+) Transcript_13757:63-1886(+)